MDTKLKIAMGDAEVLLNIPIQTTYVVARSTLQPLYDAARESIRLQTVMDTMFKLIIEGGKRNVSVVTDGVDVVQYCRIHAKRAESEGLTKTALVLTWAADEIETLRSNKST